MMIKVREGVVGGSIEPGVLQGLTKDEFAAEWFVNSVVH